MRPLLNALTTDFTLTDKLWYCRLSPNHKVLHYGDVEKETETPPIETLQEKSEPTRIPLRTLGVTMAGLDLFSWVTSEQVPTLYLYSRMDVLCTCCLTLLLFCVSVPVSDIKMLLTGKDCPHMREARGRQNRVSPGTVEAQTLMFTD